MSTKYTPERVNEAFLQSSPLLAKKILNLTLQTPSFLRDVVQVNPWPNGESTTYKQLILRGELPQIERGFDKWRQRGQITGCGDPCNPPDCNYNWTSLGGHGIQEKIATLIDRDYRSPEYCVREIQSTLNFREIFSQVVKNLFAQRNWIIEQNINFNALTGMAKKLVVDGGGFKYNSANVYTYPRLGAGPVKISALNIDMIEFIYEQMRRMPEAVPYDVVNGNPVFSLLASQQTLARLYRDDQNLRQDVRFSGYANALVDKYNFMSTIRGMFLAAPILYPRRFEADATTGELTEVSPILTNVPAQAGTFSFANPAYENAQYEEVLFHGMYPFQLMTNETESSLGEGSSFGPEFSLLNNFAWVNPLTKQDPARRSGFYFSSASIGILQQYSDSVIGVVVERVSQRLAAVYTPVPECPVDPEECTNIIPTTGCPCPVVVSLQADPFTANTYTFTLVTPITAEAEDEITFTYGNGISVTGTVEQISTDGLTVQVSFTTDLPDGACSDIVAVACDEGANLFCSALVVNATDCRSFKTNAVQLYLQRAIKAEVGETITAFMGDCTTQDLTITAIDGADLKYTVSYASGYGPTDNPTCSGGATLCSADMLCDRGGIVKVCVPPATDASCPACTSSFEACEETT